MECFPIYVVFVRVFSCCVACFIDFFIFGNLSLTLVMLYLLRLKTETETLNLSLTILSLRNVTTASSIALKPLN